MILLCSTPAYAEDIQSDPTDAEKKTLEETESDNDSAIGASSHIPGKINVKPLKSRADPLTNSVPSTIENRGASSVGATAPIPEPNPMSDEPSFFDKVENLLDAAVVELHENDPAPETIAGGVRGNEAAPNPPRPEEIDSQAGIAEAPNLPEHQEVAPQNEMQQIAEPATNSGTMSGSIMHVESSPQSSSVMSGDKGVGVEQAPSTNEKTFTKTVPAATGTKIDATSRFQNSSSVKSASETKDVKVLQSSGLTSTIKSPTATTLGGSSPMISTIPVPTIAHTPGGRIPVIKAPEFTPPVITPPHITPGGRPSAGIIPPSGGTPGGR